MSYKEFVEAIESKRLNEMSALELAFVHINGRKINKIKDGYLASVIPVVLREIAHSKEYGNSKNFLPVSASFTVLDQLGFCYSRNDMDVCKKNNGNDEVNNIKRALYYFCGIDNNSDDSDALVGLRNSFLHTASCLSKALHNGQSNYCFSIERSDGCLVEHPSDSWDGDFEKLNEDMVTVVNKEKLFNVVEASIETALNLLYENKLNVLCDEKEIYFRFLDLR